MFSAKSMRKRGRIRKLIVIRDIFKIRSRIKWFANDGENHYDVWGTSPQYRTRDEWARYFTKRGFSVTESSNKYTKVVTISWE